MVTIVQIPYQALPIAWPTPCSASGKEPLTPPRRRVHLRRERQAFPHAQAWSCDLHRYVTAEEEQRMFGNKSHDAVQPTLTAEEREAIKWFSQLSYGDGGRMPTYCATLRFLLERTK